MEKMEAYEYNVYTLDDNKCYLEIIKNEKSLWFLINKQGESEFIEISQDSIKDKSPNYNFQDYLPLAVINKIFVLINKPNVSPIIYYFQELYKKVNSDQYQYNFTDFSMEMAYKIEDYKDVLSQNYELSKDQEDLNKLNEVVAEADELFYNKSEALPNDRENIKKFLLKNIKYLELLKDH